jgi:hypothetical protein
VDDVNDLLARELAALSELPSAEKRAQRAHQLVGYLQEAGAEVSRIRREALEQLVHDGSKQHELAALLGVTRARVGQLLTSGPRAERALLGTSALTVAVGGKWEAGKTQPSAVISAESLAAYHLIADAAATYNLAADYEVVPPPGMVALNRPDLIVLGSPRLLPLVGQVLEADSHLGFAASASGVWHLVEHDTGTLYRSPSDRNEPADYGYIGRLPRPDGRGTFLYAAGIHAMGTLGAAHYLTGHIEELYQQVKQRRWSTLIECRYDADTRTIESTDRLTPVYTS